MVKQHLLPMLLALVTVTATAQPYDFQNLKLKDEKRVDLFLKHLTLEEKLVWITRSARASLVRDRVSRRSR